MSEAERWLIEDVDGMPDGVVRLTLVALRPPIFPPIACSGCPSRPNVARRSPRPSRRPSAPRIRARATAVSRATSRWHARPTLRSARGRSSVLPERIDATDGWMQALRAYRDLAAIQDIAVYRTPVDLIARRMICEILGEAGRKDDLAREAAALSRDLFGQRWLLDRAAWELAAADVARFTGALPTTGDRRALSTALDWAYAEWRQLPSSGRRTVIADDTTVTMVWRRSGAELRAVAMTAAVVDRWLRVALERELPAPVHVSLVTESGRLVAGESPEAGGHPISLSTSESGLPWTLLVGSADTSQVDAEMTARRRVLGAGVAALVLLLAGGSYLLWRVVQRELAVARLQTDFVAAVSHEFRTPLTSLRHITGLLEESDELPPGRRQSLYSILSQSTERLHRLVESLLDFARLEDGRKPWILQAVDVSGVVTDLVTSFRNEHAGVEIDLDIPERGAVGVRGRRRGADARAVESPGQRREVLAGRSASLACPCGRTRVASPLP